MIMGIKLILIFFLGSFISNLGNFSYIKVLAYFPNCFALLLFMESDHFRI